MVRSFVVLESLDPLAPGTADTADNRSDEAMRAELRSIRVLGTLVHLFGSGEEVLNQLSVNTYRPKHLCYVNAHSLNLAYKDAAYRRVLRSADLVLNDGVGLQIAARMQGMEFPTNLNGSDFTIELLRLCSDQGWRVFLYGGEPGVAAIAAGRLSSRIRGLKVVGVCNGYGELPGDELISRIRETQADVIIVALGQPIQELWLHDNLPDTGCHLGIGVGAFLDFVSGRVTRAPRWMNKLGVEWLYRLVREPGRLWSRYLVGNPLFLWRAWRCGAGIRDSI